ncbi:MAG: gluconate 2-dehydrogenase subunit 3 family protein [Gammaproteobacteria bacterium]|nr:MAG: gluconate 2-dehydrogenase subunit 3 family protein [Gammaproteobacteria bacterium]
MSRPCVRKHSLSPRLLRKLAGQRLSRRAFLRRCVEVTGASLACLPGTSALGAGSESGGFRFGARRRRLFETVQAHLLPSTGGGPGAREVHATDYLEAALGLPQFDPEIRDFLLQGAAWLEEEARAIHRRAFTALEAQAREALLARVARTEWGENWLATLLDYTLEALLCDPVYGGNPAGIGWRWLEHQPGFPRPPANKRYFLL